MSMRKLLVELLETTDYEHREAIASAFTFSQYCADGESFEQELINQMTDHPDLPVEDIIDKYNKLAGK